MSIYVCVYLSMYVHRVSSRGSSAELLFPHIAFFLFYPEPHELLSSPTPSLLALNQYSSHPKPSLTNPISRKITMSNHTLSSFMPLLSGSSQSMALNSTVSATEFMPLLQLGSRYPSHSQVPRLDDLHYSFADCES